MPPEFQRRKHPPTSTIIQPVDNIWPEELEPQMSTWPGADNLSTQNHPDISLDPTPMELSPYNELHQLPIYDAAFPVPLHPYTRRIGENHSSLVTVDTMREPSVPYSAYRASQSRELPRLTGSHSASFPDQISAPSYSPATRPSTSSGSIRRSSSSSQFFDQEAAQLLTQLSSCPEEPSYLSSVSPFSCEQQSFCTKEDCPSGIRTYCPEEELEAEQCDGSCSGRFCMDANYTYNSSPTLDQSLQEDSRRSSHGSLGLACLWSFADDTCDQRLRNKEALSRHVFQAHISSQKALDCPLECGEVISHQQLTRHLQKEHSQQDEFPCLIRGCEFKGNNEFELTEHYACAHPPPGGMECHWGGCDTTTLNLCMLSDHVLTQHIDPISKSSAVSPSPSSPPTQSPIRLSSEPSDQHFQELQTSQKVCMWVNNQVSSTSCGLAFENGNELQKHIELHHIKKRRDLSNDEPGKGTPKGSAVLACLWMGCKQCRKTFRQVQDLRDHVKTHSGCW